MNKMQFTATDEQFVACDGTLVSYQEVFTAILECIEKYCYKSCYSEEDRENLYMKAVCKAVEGAPRFNPARCTPKRWAWMIARGVVINAGERMGREIPFSKMGYPDSYDEDGCELTPEEVLTWRSDEFAADRALMEKEGMESLDSALERLPKRERMVVEMKMRGFANPEIAYRMGCSVNAVAVILSRARKALGDLLDGELGLD